MMIYVVAAENIKLVMNEKTRGNTKSQNRKEEPFQDEHRDLPRRQKHIG
jgi:hypothetical protein